MIKVNKFSHLWKCSLAATQVKDHSVVQLHAEEPQIAIPKALLLR